MALKWYRRLAEIKGVGYRGLGEADRSAIKGHDAVPELHSYEIEGTRLESMWWPTNGGGTSASPASQHASTSPGSSTKIVLRHMYEALELPGEVRDYHFVLLGAYEQLWDRRIDDPSLYEELERLCWLDLRLIEAVPDTIVDRRGGESIVYQVPAFDHLMTLYEREGALNEALGVAERAERQGQRLQKVAEFRGRLAKLALEST